MTVAEAEAAVRQAKETLALFISHKADHEKKVAALGRERAELSYEAHKGCPKSRKRLDQLHLEAAKADSEQLSLGSAISAAHVRVSDAESALRDARRREDGLVALALLAPLTDAGSAVDDAVVQLLQGLDRLRSTVRELRSLGCHPASEAAMRVAIKVALESALSDELDVPLHRPSERRAFADLSRLWAANCRTAIGRTEEEAA